MTSRRTLLRRVPRRDVSADPGVVDTGAIDRPLRSDVARGLPVPTPHLWGERIVKGLQFADYASNRDERATFRCRHLDAFRCLPLDAA